MKRLSLASAALALIAPQLAAASCGSAFCVLNTMWSTQGLPAEAGTSRVDLRYEYVNQNELRSGRHKISPEDDHEDTLEQRTVNRNLLATYDYVHTKNWSYTAQLPIVDRYHQHIADQAGAASDESWKFTRVGDMRLLATYRFDNDKNPLVSYGLTFGMKLPTGDYNVRNNDGVEAERALQPGTGSFDLVYGAYYSAAALTAESSWWVQALVQQAVFTADDFRPGNQYQLNVGYRHPFQHAWRGLLQINTLVKSRDSGAQAEPDLSGSKTVFLSPGLSYSLTNDLEAYGFFQYPLYRYVNGIQLSAPRAWVFGLTMRF